MDKMYETVVVGGTFDVLHSGHQKLIMKAFEIGKFVLIGLCSDAYIKKMNKPHGIATYTQRLEELKKYLKINGFLEKAEITILDDQYGVTLSNKKIDAIVVSEETEPRAQKINQKRNNLGLSPLSIIQVKMVLSEDHYPISSTRIWFEEIDKDGNLL
jgi:pantetheine-phosphate adenylyltransferase